MFFPFLRGGEMDILPFFEAAVWMLRGGEMDGRHAVSTVFRTYLFSENDLQSSTL